MTPGTPRAPRSSSPGARIAIPGALLAFVALIGAALDARAEPTVWRATASPQARAESQAIRDIDVLVGKSHSLIQLSPTRRDLALHFLETAGADTSSLGRISPIIAFLYGDLLRLRGERERAVPYLERAAAGGPVLLRVDALTIEGHTFARLDRAIEEAAAYQRALDFPIDTWTRSDLLANEADAFMAAGDLRRAIAGYRASLECLKGPEVMLAVTTFWGLGVALDRTGDTNEALRQISIARQYDPMDRALGDEQWTFTPEYDSAWYRALGALARARSATNPGDRVVAYRAAIDGYTDYVKRAPPGGPYVEIARKHIEKLEAEALNVPEPPSTARR